MMISKERNKNTNYSDYKERAAVGWTTRKRGDTEKELVDLPAIFSLRGSDVAINSFRGAGR
jgi:hypothetical protein